MILEAPQLPTNSYYFFTFALCPGILVFQTVSFPLNHLVLIHSMLLNNMDRPQCDTKKINDITKQKCPAKARY